MSDFTFEQALEKLQKFTQDRGWGKYHKPKDMTLKLMEEVGEVAEQFEWQSNQEVLEGLQESHKKQVVEEELIDVLIVLLMLMDLIDMDIAEAFDRKLKKNGDKYPLEQDPEEIKLRKQKGL